MAVYGAMAHSRLAKELYLLRGFYGTGCSKHSGAIFRLAQAKGFLQACHFVVYRTVFFQAHFLGDGYPFGLKDCYNLFGFAYAAHILALKVVGTTHKQAESAVGAYICVTGKHATCDIIKVGIGAHKHCVNVVGEHQCSQFFQAEVDFRFLPHFTFHFS